MTDLTGSNLSFYRSTLFFRELYRLGLRHVVISPGSRSTPLTLAAAAFTDIKKHIILDERSAGFTAMGIGKGTGLPAVLICTSGTAAANYYPSVIEARRSGVPMLLATADRPDRLRNTDANQTIDQIELYGKFACTFRDIQISGESEKGQAVLKNTTKEAFEEAINFPGPVHLNFPFEKPLEPEPEYLNKIQKENNNFVKKFQPEEKPDEQNLFFQFPDPLGEAIKTSQKPLIIIGQLPANISIANVFDLASKLGAPVLSEQAHPAGKGSIQGFEGFLRDKQKQQQLEPDLILRFGLQPASKSLLLALDNWSPEKHIYIASASDPRDTALPVSHKVLWGGNNFDTEHFAASLTDWIKTWKDAESTYAGQKLSLMKNLRGLSDGHVYEHLSDQIPTDWTTFFSNSFPARDRSMFGNWAQHPVYTNRGASGIDGITSTAIGVGIGTGRPGILFTGDLAFLHDTNALLNSKLLKEPLAIVVINNQGGSIFRMLPVADYQPYFKEYFETPQQADLAKLTGSYGLPFQRITTIDELNNFKLADFIKENAIGSKLHILECQTDPDTSMELRNRLWGKS